MIFVKSYYLVIFLNCEKNNCCDYLSINIDKKIEFENIIHNLYLRTCLRTTIVTYAVWLLLSKIS